MAAWLLAAALSLARAGPLDYPPGPFEAEVSSEASSGPWSQFLVRFPSPVESPFPANDTVWGHLSVPEGEGPFPAVLVLPVMAAPNIEIEKRFISRLRKDGLAVMWLEMPYQFHRVPAPLVPSGQVFLARTARRLAFNFRQSVLDARRALDWLSRHPDVDRGSLAVFGISLGALVGAAVYSVDPLPAYGVFLLGGADFPELVRESSMTGPFVRKAGITREEIEAAWEGIDPLDYRQSNGGKPALLVNVRSDRVIPKASALKLAQAFPDGRQVWLPFGHYSAIVHLVWMPRMVSREIRKAFSAAGPGKKSNKTQASP